MNSKIVRRELLRDLDKADNVLGLVRGRAKDLVIHAPQFVREYFEEFDKSAAEAQMKIKNLKTYLRLTKPLGGSDEKDS